MTDRLSTFILYSLGFLVLSAWLFMWWAFYMENVR